MNENDPLVCVIDDDSSTRESLSNLLRSAGLKVQAFASAQDFLTNWPLEAPGCLVLDIQLPGISGLDLQQELVGGHAQIPIIFMTGYGDIPMTVRAMKAGAFEFLTKPFRDEDLLSAVDQAVKRGRQMGQLNNKPTQKQPYGDDKLRSEISFSEIVGKSAALRQVLQQVETVAPTDSTVLILGETGTGKELIARAVHQRSRRKHKPLVRVNCTSIPKELFESEFFGHVKGAFTGAIKDRAGRFEAAAGGTLFLDEVGEIPLELQSKLLRVLQEKSYERVGEEKTRRTDVRIVAATNRDLEKQVAAGRFREDLYYRLNVFPLRVSPLRDRKEDIPLLATYFVELLAKELDCPKPRLTRAGVEALQGYNWPGNIRELRNVIERAVIFARGGALEFDIPGTGSLVDLTSFGPPDIDQAEPDQAAIPATAASDKNPGRPNAVGATFTDCTRALILERLQATGWLVGGPGGAAKRLGLKRTTLVAKMKKLGISRPTPQIQPLRDKS
jgi:DNA-binding NtrC family response regulator